MYKSNLELLIEKFTSNPRSMNVSSGKLSKRTGFSKEEVLEAKEQVRRNLGITKRFEIVKEVVDEVKNLLGITETETDHQTGNQKFTLNSTKPLTPKEIEELVGVDNITIFVDRSWLKSHKNGTWTYSVLTVNKHKSFTEGQFLENLKKINFPKLVIKHDCSKTEHEKEEVEIEISIADFHLDRKTLKEDSIESRSVEYIDTVNDLVSKVNNVYTIKKCIFTIGNDFLNSDNYQGATTNLTPQDNSVTWDKAYEVAFTTLVNAITILKDFSKEVQVKLINGNHDRTKMYYISHGLEQYFYNTWGIEFDRTSSMLKYNVLGNTFIGYHHGNCKIDELPLIFATSPETSKAFGNAIYREIHTADKHFYMEKEIKGVRILQTPSMVNPDRWSNDNNFINNVRAGLVLVYHPEKGRVALFEHRI